MMEQIYLNQMAGALVLFLAEYSGVRQSLWNLKSFPGLGFPASKKPQPCAINKQNYHKPWDCRHVEIPVILTSACFLLFLFVLGNVTCEQLSGSKPILGWAHASVDQCAMLLDLWTCETAFLEKKSQVQKIFGLKTVISNQFALGCIRFPFKNVSCCAFIWMLEPATRYIL